MAGTVNIGQDFLWVLPFPSHYHFHASSTFVFHLSTANTTFLSIARIVKWNTFSLCLSNTCFVGIYELKWQENNVIQLKAKFAKFFY
jgi:hypothetical protein